MGRVGGVGEGILSEKIRLGISCGLSARQTIHIKCHLTFSENNRKEKLK